MDSFLENSKQWKCVEIPCEAAYADALAAMVAERFVVGVEIAAPGIRFYLNESSLPGHWESRLQGVIDEFAALFKLPMPIAWQSHSIADAGWADAWKVHFKPLRVGERFIVCPTWEEPGGGEQDLVIRIDPGQAFGTGHHETTRLCLEWLDHWDRNRAHLNVSLLDVGTGSGILAIAAGLLGYAEVVAVDIDPEAIAVAEENIALNRLRERINLVHGSAADVSGRFDVVLANIQAAPLIEMALVLTGKLKSSGTLVLSGVLVEQKEQVRDAYAKQFLNLRGDRSAGEWCSLEFGRN
jgi:ribosomal protein L11 methyltransferase